MRLLVLCLAAGLIQISAGDVQTEVGTQPAIHETHEASRQRQVMEEQEFQKAQALHRIQQEQHTRELQRKQEAQRAQEQQQQSEIEQTQAVAAENDRIREQRLQQEQTHQREQQEQQARIQLEEQQHLQEQQRLQEHQQIEKDKEAAQQAQLQQEVARRENERQREVDAQTKREQAYRQEHEREQQNSLSSEQDSRRRQEELQLEVERRAAQEQQRQHVQKEQQRAQEQERELQNRLLAQQEAQRQQDNEREAKLKLEHELEQQRVQQEQQQEQQQERQQERQKALEQEERQRAIEQEQQQQQRTREQEARQEAQLAAQREVQQQQQAAEEQLQREMQEKGWAEKNERIQEEQRAQLRERELRRQLNNQDLHAQQAQQRQQAEPQNALHQQAQQQQLHNQQTQKQQHDRLKVAHERVVQADGSYFDAIREAVLQASVAESRVSNNAEQADVEEASQTAKNSIETAIEKHIESQDAIEELHSAARAVIMDGTPATTFDPTPPNHLENTLHNMEHATSDLMTALQAAAITQGNMQDEVAKALDSALTQFSQSASAQAASQSARSVGGQTPQTLLGAAGAAAATKAAKAISKMTPSKTPQLTEEQKELNIEIDRLLSSAHDLCFPVGKQPSEQNVLSAIELLEAAAAKGSAAALNRLGEIYYFGEGGLTPEYEKGFSFFQKAADMGEADGQHNVAVAYSLGLPVPADDAMSLLFDFFAAMGGSNRARLALGYRHLYGYGVPQSCESAVLYYQDVAEEVIDNLEANPVPPLIERVRLSDDTDKNAVPEEDQEVIQYYQHSAEGGDKAAQAALGHYNLYGARGVTQNFELALRYLQAAAAQGDAVSMAYLAKMYLHGLGVEADDTKALRYYNDAATAGSSAGKTGFAMMALQGRGMTADPKTFMRYIKAASEQGYAEAQYQLGLWHLTGAEKALPTALNYFSLAAQQGHTNALYQLSLMHLGGLGTLRNCQIGVKLLKSVAERSEPAAELGRAHRNFIHGRSLTSWMLYSRAAEEGFEVAQSNSAWLLDLGVAVAVNSTVRNLQHASEQGNVDALRLLGDHQFYGKEGAPDYGEAVRFYQLASSSRNAQSMFNLGYMHQHGLGLDRDFELAKRHYDQALETDSQALVPVRLALAGLWVHSAVEAVGAWWSGKSSSASLSTSTPSGSSSSASSSASSSSASASSSSSSSASSSTARSKPKTEDPWNSFLSGLAGLDIEDILLLVLCSIFALMVLLRGQPRA